MFRKFMGNGNFRLLLESVEAGENCSVFGLNIGEKLATTEGADFLFYVVGDIDDTVAIEERLWAMGRKCAIMPKVIDLFSGKFSNFEQVLKVLYGIKRGEIDAVIMTPEVLSQKVPSIDDLVSVSLKVGDDVSLDGLTKKLVSFGYKRVDMVSGVGEFTLRGDVLDIYPLGGEPTRITTDFDTIDGIKLYNSVTMLASKSLNSIEIPMCKFFMATQQNVHEYYDKFGLKKDGGYFEIIDNLASDDCKNMVFDKRLLGTIFDYVQNGMIVFDGAKNIYSRLNDYILSYNEKLKGASAPYKKVFEKALVSTKDLLSFPDGLTLVAFQAITEANRIFTPNKVFSIRTLPSVNYVRHTNVLSLDLANYSRLGYTVILCAGGDENKTRLALELDRFGVTYSAFDMVSQCIKSGINIVRKNYPLDILLPEEKLAVISTKSLFGLRKKVVETESVSFEGDAPKAGDYVVHNTHGIGKCLGVETLKISGGFRDYVLMEYKGGDKVYLPVENLDQITKYVGGEKAPALNKIGGTDFAKTKEKVKSAVKKIAFDLIALYRERLNAKGHTYPIDTDMQADFENSFQFDETVDQQKAIDDCKLDMESGKIMDRLVCGDVGFGKTEVALRVAFKTILSGKQVAFMCPTTILSEQHYNTALSRMADFGVKVAVLNRLKTPKQVEQIKREIGEGKIDLVCGTQKLLASDINYKNLGLLILDEEQKFGVADKEKIKNIKKRVNVLTLSATPIPRTLNMALMGIRDISVISTPPVIRQSVVVNVLEYSDEMLKTAISRELDRDGQVLIVYNRIESVYGFANHIRLLFEGVKVSVAHGKMTSAEMETEILNLYSGKTQILVSTTIIENGIDLPNANTLIVINSDTLGLSQLYQLKGRVGRSDKLAFAYFTFDGSKALSETAYKRLEAIEEFSEMGSGFKIAMRDLEIRGAGSVLGAEQSGHIEKVGYNMYVQMLGDTVKELKGEEVENRSEVRVETNISAYLSKEYVESTNKRMSMYKDIARISSRDLLKEFLTSTESVYGEPPIDLVNLCKISLIKNLASKIGATKVIIRKSCKIILEDRDRLTKNIVLACEAYPDNVSLDLSVSPTIEIKGVAEDDVLDFLVAFLMID